MSGRRSLAGLWELPGGKVAAGESDADGLARELHEELGVEVTVGARLGEDVALNETMTLRAYRVTQIGGVLRPNDHRALRWVTADELASLPWVPADRAWLGELAARFARSTLARRSASSGRANLDLTKMAAILRVINAALASATISSWLFLRSPA